MSAAGVMGSTAPLQGAGAGSIPSAALHELRVTPIPFSIAKVLVVRQHYLHSMPGGTRLAFGVLVHGRLLGAITLGVGPTNAHRLVTGVEAGECLTLTRLWLDDQLPKNSESKAIGIVLRAVKRHTTIKMMVRYADPAQGHVGVIYQAAGWLYAGLSEPTPLYALGDGQARHSRSLSHAFGSHSLKHFSAHGVRLRVVPQVAKHRYLYLLDLSLRGRIAVPVLPYPKREASDAGR